MNEIENITHLEHLLNLSEKEIKRIAFQNIDLTSFETLLKDKTIIECLFLGCTMSASLSQDLVATGNLVFPKMDVPFETYPARLYTRQTMYNDFNLRGEFFQ